MEKEFTDKDLDAMLATSLVCLIPLGVEKGILHKEDGETPNSPRKYSLTDKGNELTSFAING